MDYNKEYYDSYFNRLDNFVKNSDMEKRVPYSLLEDQAGTKSYVLSIQEDTVLDFLDIALEQTHLLLDNETFFICDLSKEKQTPYNTLVFQLHGAPLKSKETTTQVIDRYFKYISMDYKSIMQFGKSLGILRYCPFVLGSICYTPIHGASKRHVSWLALHHVQDIVSHQKATYFNIDTRHELVLNISYKKATRLIQQTKLLSDSQQKMTSEWLALMHHHSHLYSRPNVVTRCTTHSPFSKPLPLLSSWLMTQSYLQARTMIKGMLKESDPLLDYMPPEEGEGDDNCLNDDEE